MYGLWQLVNGNWNYLGVFSSLDAGEMMTQSSGPFYLMRAPQ